MYVPPLFAEQDPARLHQAIRATRLATLVTEGRLGLIATHLPLLLDPEPAPYGTLLGHVARANPQWREALGREALGREALERDGAKPEALAIFQGPDAYISPSWYPSKRESGKVVPTWNYVAVHAYGPLEIFEDAEPLLALVTRLTEAHEGPRAERWKVEDAPADFIAAQLKAIVGFRLPITRLEGKWKMSQNRPPADRAGVIAGLEALGTPDGLAVAALVAERNRA